MLPRSGFSNGVTKHDYPVRSFFNERYRRGRRSSKETKFGGRVSSFERSPCTEFDKAYFQSYSHLSIHEEMIKDHVRTETYRAAIMQYQSFIADKVVVDVGCGTGILSIFCALAGAKRVYAVDASDIAVQAREVVKANNLSDKVIVLLGRIESMLSSVIIARDRWLKPGGLILPSHAALYMAPVTHSERYSESIDFWRNVYGIDMSVLLPLAKQCSFEEPSVETISGENVLTWPIEVKHIDCYTVTIQELESITAKFRFESMMQASFNGFAFWFDVEFNGPINFPSSNDHSSSTPCSTSSCTGSRKKRSKSNEMLVLSTAPEDAPTHWQQTLVYFYDPIEVRQDQVIEGSVTLSQSKENQRFLNIHLEYASGGRCFVKESVLR